MPVFLSGTGADRRSYRFCACVPENAVKVLKVFSGRADLNEVIENRANCSNYCDILEKPLLFCLRFFFFVSYFCVQSQRSNRLLICKFL